LTSAFMPPSSADCVVCQDLVLGLWQARLVRLNRPQKRNSLDPKAIGLLMEMVRSCRAQWLVISAAPPAFCAGFDLDALGDAMTAPRGYERAVGQLYRCYCELLRFRGETVALVDGPAVGGGAGLALCCDHIIATPRASLLLPEGPLRPLASIVLPLANRRGLETWSGATLDAGTAASSGAVDLILQSAPERSALTEILQSLATRRTPDFNGSMRQLLDRKSACAVLRDAFAPKSIAQVADFLKRRRQMTTRDDAPFLDRRPS
jgi:enoyl-CoA hydratase/carnithine racemase